MAPSLLELCSKMLVDLVQQDAEKRKELLNLQHYLLQNILPKLSPFTLEHLCKEAGSKPWFPKTCVELSSRGLKRKRSLDDTILHQNRILCCLNCAWQHHFHRRWSNGFKNMYVDILSTSEVKLLGLGEQNGRIDWRQRYWEAHIQECLNEVTAKALTSPLQESLGDTPLSSKLLEEVGIGIPHTDTINVLYFSSLKNNLLYLAEHARSLRLRGVLCTEDVSIILSSCTNLHHLKVYHITTTTQVNALCSLFGQVRRNLKVLEFHHCRFCEDEFSKINASLHVDGPGYNKLSHLIVASSNMIYEGSKQFIQFLKSSRYLKSLVLLDNHFSPTAAVDLLSVVLETLQHLVLFTLSENELEGFSTQCPKTSMPEIRLNALDLRSNWIGPDEIRECLPYFCRMKLLKHLKLNDNPIGDNGLRMLTPVLQTCCVVNLGLSACNLSSSAACFLFNILTSTQRHMQKLDLSSNPLGSSVAIPLAKFLKYGLVERLNLGDIGLGANGCLELYDALETIPRMSHFVLRENRLGSNAAKLISKLVTQPSSLKLMDFSGNLLDRECLNLIASSLQVCSGTLECLDLRNNLVKSMEIFRSVTRPVVLLSRIDLSYDDDP